MLLRNKALFLNSILFVILYTASLFSERIFLAMGQDEKTASMAAEYISILYPGVFFQFVFQIYTLYFVA